MDPDDRSVARNSESDDFVGIDLAWGSRDRTGLAVVDDAGVLTASATMSSDDEIEEWLWAAAPHPIVVAVDAPLVVPNETGQRVAETLIGKAFGRYGASAHTSNRAKSHFNPPRAEVLARRFGWCIDPETETGGSRTVCIEVYPHPALVGLFQLPQRVLYKKGPNRQAGFVELATCLESVPELQLRESNRWAEIRHVIEQPRPGELERVEDEVDAILCAHLGWLWHHRRDALQVYGSRELGYIVAPPPPTHPATRPARSGGASKSPLTIRNLPEGVRRGLEAHAARHDQSVEAEVLAILAAAVATSGETGVGSPMAETHPE